MRLCRWWAVLISAMAMCGCARVCYEIEITPDGDGIQRNLKCWQEGTDAEEGADVSEIDEEELARIEELYGKREADDPDGKQVFQGRFTDTMPNDVGGAGTYLHYESPLGTTSSYIERSRGNDDVQAVLEKRRRAVNKLVDHLRAWVEAEVGDEPNFAQLDKFIDKQLRRDLTNLTLFLWTVQAQGEESDDAMMELAARAAQYLREREYISPKDVPLLIRGMGAEDEKLLLTHLRRLAARELGVAEDEPLPETLDFLADKQQLEASWKAYVETTDAYAKRMKQWEKEEDSPEVEQSNADRFTNELFEAILLGLIGPGPNDSLKIALKTGRQPYETNGQWDADSGKVTWEHSLPKAPVLPLICFAVWSNPNEEFQRAHFGKVLLSGEELTEYVLWYAAMTADELKQWDAFIAGCKPGEKLKERIEDFRLSGDPEKMDEDTPHLADTPRRLLLQALEPEE